MKTHHPKLKTSPRPLFSCGFFRRCTQTVLSPTTTTTTAPPFPISHSQPPPPPPLPPPSPASFNDNPPPQSSSSSSSSSNTSQSFTQWRFPLPNSPITHHRYPPDPTREPVRRSAGAPPPPALCADLEELFHVAELQLSTGSGYDRVRALHLLEHSLVPNPGAAAADGGVAVTCPEPVMRGVVGCLKIRDEAKPASKVLLALCLAEGNRHVAVEVGAAGAVVEALPDLDNAVAERALAALELLCTVAEGAAEVRAHVLAVPMMVEMMGRMEGRGKEYAISVLAVIYGGCCDGAWTAPPEEVARAVMLALQGSCSARGKRKGAQLLKILQDHGRADPTRDELLEAAQLL